ncbi:YqcC family protein [Marinomonas epiphytica]
MKHKDSPHHQLADLLLELQASLYQAGVWQCEQPSPQAMASQEPFCINTMSFAQWLRYVLIAKLSVLIEQQLALPSRCHISPMAQEAFKSLAGPERQTIITKLDLIDQFLSLQSQ